MKKTALTGGMLCLLILFISMSSQTIFIKAVTADNATVVYTSEYLELYPDEHDRASEINYEIFMHMYNYGDFSYLLNSYSPSSNTVGSVADSCEDNYDYTAVLYYGHGQNEWCGTNLHHYLMVSDTEKITDRFTLYGNTSQSEHDFVFLWACKTGNQRGYWCSGCSKPYGFPYTWLYDSYQSSDGYDSPDTDDEVFLGWYMGSPGYTNSTGYSSFDYGHFIEKFYYYILSDNQSVIQALNSATDDTIGDDSFNVTDIHIDNDGIDVHGYTTWLVVYGNGNKGLPT